MTVSAAPIRAEAPRVLARAAGAVYLFVIVSGLFAFSVRSGMIVRGDASTTAAHILASEPRFRFGLLAEVASTAGYIAVVALLYGLLKPAGRSLSRLAASFGFAGCVVAAVLAINFLAALVLLGDTPFLAVFSTEQRQALAMLSLRLNGHGSSISFFFFGSYCLMLGMLVLRSRFLPRILGAGLWLAGLGWLAGSVATILSPPLGAQLSSYTMMTGGLGEGAFTLWLLVMGVDPDKWRSQEAGR